MVPIAALWPCPPTWADVSAPQESNGTAPTLPIVIVTSHDPSTCSPSTTLTPGHHWPSCQPTSSPPTGLELSLVWQSNISPARIPASSASSDPVSSVVPSPKRRSLCVPVLTASWSRG